MKLTTHKCLCGNDACTSLLLLLDGELLDGIHRAEVVAKLETAVNLHDELVEALRQFADVLSDEVNEVSDMLSVPCPIPAKFFKDAKATLAKLETKG